LAYSLGIFEFKSLTREQQYLKAVDCIQTSDMVCGILPAAVIKKSFMLWEQNDSDSNEVSFKPKQICQSTWMRLIGMGVSMYAVRLKASRQNRVGSFHLKQARE